MSRRISPTLIALSALLVVALTAGVFAHGYAQIRPPHRDVTLSIVVICGGDGPQSILMDENGDPVDPTSCLRELCSACLTAPFLAFDVAPALPSLSLTWRTASFATPTAPGFTARPASDHRARAPPFPA